MALVTACVRPSGASYRDELLAHVHHKNPSEIIDDLLKDNNGFLVYQEDCIKFLQNICGLSGSEADNIRRAIARKKRDKLDEAMPAILEGYCSKSSQPREIAEKEAEEFLQIIEDSANYQFGLSVSPFLVNHITHGCSSHFLNRRKWRPREELTGKPYQSEGNPVPSWKKSRRSNDYLC